MKLDHIKARTRDRFLFEYATAIRTRLNAFLGASDLTVSASVMAGKVSRITLVHGEYFTSPGVRLFQATDFEQKSLMAVAGRHISYCGSRILIVKKSLTIADMNDWSNVSAWNDADQIINEVLSAKRRDA